MCNVLSQQVVAVQRHPVLALPFQFMHVLQCAMCLPNSDLRLPEITPSMVTYTPWL